MGRAHRRRLGRIPGSPGRRRPACADHARARARHRLWHRRGNPLSCQGISAGARAGHRHRRGDDPPGERKGGARPRGANRLQGRRCVGPALARGVLRPGLPAQHARVLRRDRPRAEPRRLGHRRVELWPEHAVLHAGEAAALEVPAARDRPGRNRRRRRGHVLRWPTRRSAALSLGTYLGGLALFAITLGSVLAAATIVVNRRLRHLAGAPRTLAFAVIASLGLIWAHLVPGMAGLLGRASVPLVAVAFAGLATLIPPADPGVREEAPSPTAESAWEWRLAVGIATAVGCVAIAYLLANAGTPTHGIDAVKVGLPGIVQWIQSGSFWPVHQIDLLTATGNYPNN